MRPVFSLVIGFFSLLGVAPGAGNFSPPSRGFTLDEVMSAPFAGELTASAAGAKVAWVLNAAGARNIWVAEPPLYRGRQLTSYTADDGEDIADLAWSPDAALIAYTRGEGANSSGEYPNPTSDPKGTKQQVWVVPIAGGPPRLVGEGSSPAISPRGDRLAFVRNGDIWAAALAGDSKPVHLMHARGRNRAPVWSPDGSRLAFVSDRDDHGFIGVYDFAAGTLVWLDPSIDFDRDPVWSADGKNIAFLRIATLGDAFVPGPVRTAHPWSIRLADAATGKGRLVWRAAEGPGSAFRELAGSRQIFWCSGGRLVFPWERDGWLHLYSVPLEGGNAELLTPGDFEVEHAAAAPGGGELVFSSNQGNIDGRHIWSTGVTPSRAKPVTSGAGIEWSPVVTSDGKAIAYLCSDAQLPSHPVIRLESGATVDIAPQALPAAFPKDAMVKPRIVIFPSADGLEIHGQLFEPANMKPAPRLPAVIFLHGGSHRQMLPAWHYSYYYHNAYAFNQYLASRGYLVLSVNYRSGTGYGLNFREALNYGPAGASEFNDVLGAALYLRHRADVDPARMGLWGGSYGGYLTAMGLARASDQFAAGVDMHGVHDWSALLAPLRPELSALAFRSSPMAYVKDWRSPVLLIHGDDDRNVNFSQTVNLAQALRKQRVDCEDLVFPDEIHDFLRHAHWLEAYKAAFAFFERNLRNK
ncbi:MAG: S9 family peptidase [Acidobacteria bacterium]|nr:S9 family peptidase [Acidobacteriota bacterium]